MLLAMNIRIGDFETRKVTVRGGSKGITLPKEFVRDTDKVFLIQISRDVLLISKKRPEIDIKSLLEEADV